MLGSPPMPQSRRRGAGEPLMPQGCSVSLGVGVSPHPPLGAAVGGTVLPALVHRRVGTSGGPAGDCFLSPRPTALSCETWPPGCPFSHCDSWISCAPQLREVSRFMEVPRY